jgi:hypothetical protein
MTISDPLDALTAAPEHHHLLMENEFVRVLETRIEPGDVVPLHTHPYPAAGYVLAWSDVIRRDANGTVTFDSKEAGVRMEPKTSCWLPSLGPHTLENVGDRPVHIICVELKTSG